LGSAWFSVSGRVDLDDAEDWIRAHVEPVGPIETSLLPR
jgi:hypothetical protein